MRSVGCVVPGDRVQARERMVRKGEGGSRADPRLRFGRLPEGQDLRDGRRRVQLARIHDALDLTQASGALRIPLDRRSTSRRAEAILTSPSGNCSASALMPTGGAFGQRLDVTPDAPCRGGQLRVLEQFVADHGGVAFEAFLRMGDAGVGMPGLRGRGRARLLGSHGEGSFFLDDQALAVGWQSRRGPKYVWTCRRRRCRTTSPPCQLSSAYSLRRVIAGDGRGGLGSFPGSLVFDVGKRRVMGPHDPVPPAPPIRSCSTPTPPPHPSGRRTPLRSAGLVPTPRR